jgi:hypothetical protein
MHFGKIRQAHQAANFLRGRIDFDVEFHIASSQFAGLAAK